jgi:hypothetical protein
LAKKNWPTIMERAVEGGQAAAYPDLTSFTSVINLESIDSPVTSCETHFGPD